MKSKSSAKDYTTTYATSSTIANDACWPIGAEVTYLSLVVIRSAHIACDVLSRLCVLACVKKGRSAMINTRGFLYNSCRAETIRVKLSAQYRCKCMYAVNLSVWVYCMDHSFLQLHGYKI